VLLDAKLAARMDAIKATEGITLAEQVRRAMQLWLESFDRTPEARAHPYEDPKTFLKRS
jgi:hypothetical protein